MINHIKTKRTPTSFGTSVKKSHTIETARCIYAPAYPPAVAHRRDPPTIETRHACITSQILVCAHPNTYPRGLLTGGGSPQGKGTATILLPFLFLIFRFSLRFARSGQAVTRSVRLRNNRLRSRLTMISRFALSERRESFSDSQILSGD